MNDVVVLNFIKIFIDVPTAPNFLIGNGALSFDVINVIVFDVPLPSRMRGPILKV